MHISMEGRDVDGEAESHRGEEHQHHGYIGGGPGTVNPRGVTHIKGPHRDWFPEGHVKIVGITPSQLVAEIPFVGSHFLIRFRDNYVKHNDKEKGGNYQAYIPVN